MHSIYGGGLSGRPANNSVLHSRECMWIYKGSRQLTDSSLSQSLPVQTSPLPFATFDMHMALTPTPGHQDVEAVDGHPVMGTRTPPEAKRNGFP